MDQVHRQWHLLNRRIERCDRCPRLRKHCRLVAQIKRAAYRGCDYWGRPVPNLGEPTARLLIVGLAPGAHGANRTGRMFTGDRSGDFLFAALHATGFATQPTSVGRDDGLALINCAITAVVHCAPPGNRPTPAELANCYGYLQQTVNLMRDLRGVVALGGVAFAACARLFGQKQWLPAGVRPRFAHDVLYRSAGRPFLAGCYHPSQQNTFTGRLTPAMMRRVFARAAGELSAARVVVQGRSS